MSDKVTCRRGGTLGSARLRPPAIRIIERERVRAKIPAKGSLTHLPGRGTGHPGRRGAQEIALVPTVFYSPRAAGRRSISLRSVGRARLRIPSRTEVRPLHNQEGHAATFPGNAGLLGLRMGVDAKAFLLFRSNVNYPYCHEARERVGFAKRNFAGFRQRNLFSCPGVSDIACRPPTGR
jgi:hypothetical protein